MSYFEWVPELEDFDISLAQQNSQFTSLNNNLKIRNLMSDIWCLQSDVLI